MDWRLRFSGIYYHIMAVLRDVLEFILLKQEKNLKAGKGDLGERFSPVRDALIHISVVDTSIP